MTATVSVVRRTDVDAALAAVIDPELDEPITDLGFVTECAVRDGHVLVRLRLPTAFCSPNFAYLMASDAFDAIRELPGVRSVRVLLDDHHDSDRINAGIAVGRGFVAAFPDEATGELDDLRHTFQVKAHAAFIERVCTIMLREHDWEVEGLGRLTIADLPPGKATDGLLKRRADLGLSCAPQDRVMVDERGTPWQDGQIPMKLRFAKAIRISIDGNAHFCRGLLRTRYPDAAAAQHSRMQDSYANDTMGSMG